MRKMPALALLSRNIWVVFVLGCACALYAPLCWNGTIGELGNSDATFYLLMAEHYSPWAAADPVIAQAAAASRFPPIYPLAIAWLGNPANFYVVHMLTGSMLIGALATFYVWLRVEGAAAAAAALLVLAFAALRGSWLLALSINSEFLYLLFSTLALVLIAVSVRPQRHALLYAAAVAVALASLTRAAGIALFAPLLIGAIRQQPKALPLILLIAVAPQIEWHLLHGAASYGSILGGVYRNDPLGTLVSQLRAELPALNSGFSANFLDNPRPSVFAGLLGLACLTALVWRVALGRPDAIYVLAYGLMLLIWPYPGEARRFIWPVVGLLLAQPLLLFGPQRSIGSKAPAWPLAVVATAVALLSLPALVRAADRYRDGPYQSGLPSARGYEAWYGRDPALAVHDVNVQITLIDTIRRIPEKVSGQDCVLSIRPEFIQLFAHRRSDFPPPDSLPDPKFFNELRASGCHYAFVSTTLDSRYPIPLYPVQRLAEPLDVLDNSGVVDPPPGESFVTAMLVRLN
jgi:hypothetical protein